MIRSSEYDYTKEDVEEMFFVLQEKSILSIIQKVMPKIEDEENTKDKDIDLSNE